MTDNIEYPKVKKYISFNDDDISEDEDIISIDRLLYILEEYKKLYPNLKVETKYLLRVDFQYEREMTEKEKEYHRQEVEWKRLALIKRKNQEHEKEKEIYFRLKAKFESEA
jgi:hypothetical protein